MDILIILIDSLPHYCISTMNFWKQTGMKYVGVKSGFGYSINIKAELFAGKRPDDVGFFNEWTVHHDTVAHPSLVARAYRWVRGRLPLIDRVTHYLVRKLGFGNFLNVPFDMALRVRRWGLDIYDGGIEGSILQKGGFRVLAYEKAVPNDGTGDEYILGLAKEMIGEPRLFVSFCDLDCVGHEYGVNSRQYEQRLRKLDLMCEELIAQFLKRHPRGAVAVLSDHGMVDVVESVNIEPVLGALGVPWYFVDSTLLRLWDTKPMRLSRLGKKLTAMGIGRIVTEEEREYYGIRSRTFGDMVFVLNPGLVFAPNFFGVYVPKGMHGYHPEIAEDQGVFCSNVLGTSRTIEAVDVHRILCGWLTSDA